jgi:hypothetical protein
MPAIQRKQFAQSIIDMPKGFLRREKAKGSTSKGFLRRAKGQPLLPQSPTCVTELLTPGVCLSDEGQSISPQTDQTSVSAYHDGDSEMNSEWRHVVMNFGHLEVDQFVKCRTGFDELNEEDLGAYQEIQRKAETIEMNSALPKVVQDIVQIEFDEDSDCHPEFAEFKEKIHESMIYVQETNPSGNDEDNDGDEQSFDSQLSAQQQLLDFATSTVKAQLETVEERQYFVARIQALEKLLEEQRKEDHAHGERQIELDRKAAEAEELLHQVDTLQKQLQAHQGTIEKLKEERDSHQQTLSRLGRAISRFGLHVPLGDPGTEIDDCASLVTISEQEEFVSSDSAVLLTINHLMMIVEALEDERQGFMTEIKILGATIHELKQEREAKELKISVLEDQFEVMDKQFKVMDAAVKDGPLTSCH